MVTYEIHCPNCEWVKATTEKTIHILKRCPLCKASLKDVVAATREVAAKKRIAMVRQIGDALKGVIADSVSDTPEDFYWDWIVQIGRRPDAHMADFSKAAQS